jgi:hypothetical protein
MEDTLALAHSTNRAAHGSPSSILFVFVRSAFLGVAFIIVYFYFSSVAICSVSVAIDAACLRVFPQSMRIKNFSKKSV